MCFEFVVPKVRDEATRKLKVKRENEGEGREEVGREKKHFLFLSVLSFLVPFVSFLTSVQLSRGRISFFADHKRKTHTKNRKGVGCE